MKKTKLAFLLPIILLTACSSTEVKQQQNKTSSLNDAQLKALLVDKTMMGRKDGTNWTTIAKSDGTLAGTYGSDNDDVGIYTIKNNRYCSKWSTWRDGDKSCWIMYKRANDYYGKLVSGSSNSFSFNIK